MRNFLNEFKTFALKGNAVNLAVGVIIGAAFQSIVSALTDAIISPLLALVFSLFSNGNENAMTSMSNFSFTIGDSVVFPIGTLIMAIINFLITAMVLFILVRAMNRLMHTDKEPEPGPEPRKCPYCFSEVAEKAIRCPHCTSVLGASGLNAAEQET